MATIILILPFLQNIKSKVQMACHQRIRPYNFMKTQKVRRRWHEKEAYNLSKTQKNKVLMA